LLAAVLLVGCGGGGSGSPGAGGTSGGGTSGGGTGGGGPACPTSSATGTLSVTVSGTPSGAGLLTVGGSQITADTDLTLPAGTVDVVAFLVAEGTASSMVRTAYSPTIDVPQPCVHAGASTTVNVTYAPIASSGKLWFGASNAVVAGTMFGYTPTSVAGTNTTAAEVAADTHGSDGFTFDALGNLWVTGATTQDPPVARYPASVLGADGAKTPDVTIDSPSFTGATPGPKVVAFDGLGNLWVSVVALNKVVKFSPDQFAQTSPTANVEQSGIDAPSGIAFDGGGNMWVASNGASTVVRIDAGHLLSSGSGADLTITATSSLTGMLARPFGLAFDADSSLWVNYDGTLAKFIASDLAGSGATTLTPSVMIGTDVQALPEGIAFDELGGLWLAWTVGKFARYDPTQLLATSTAAPQTIITGTDLGSAAWVAIYPAPAFTPLAHALP
jgi:sugar lactone lactonase YvrE